MKNETEVPLNFHQIWLVILMMRLNFLINHYWLVGKVQKLEKTFVNNSSVNIQSSKTQLFTIVQSGGFRGKILESLIKTGLT